MATNDLDRVVPLNSPGCAAWRLASGPSENGP